MTVYHIDTQAHIDDINEEEIGIGDIAVMDGKRLMCVGIADDGEAIQYIWQKMNKIEQEKQRSGLAYQKLKQRRKRAKQSRQRNR